MLSFPCKEKQEKLTLGIRTLVRTLQNEIHEWESSYVITAPIAGKVCYMEPWHVGMSLKQHQALFAIIPNDNAYVAYVQLSGQGFGKVKIGQKVMLNLFPYPHHEYGYLKGVVQEINNMPHQTQYSVTITLTQDLKTTYNKELPFKPDMEGIAEILTEELSLLQRIFYSVLKLTKQ